MQKVDIHLPQNISFCDKNWFISPCEVCPQHFADVHLEHVYITSVEIIRINEEVKQI
jgi:hypothetical protein